MEMAQPYVLSVVPMKEMRYIGYDQVMRRSSAGEWRSHDHNSPLNQRMKAQPMKHRDKIIINDPFSLPVTLSNGSRNAMTTRLVVGWSMRKEWQGFGEGELPSDKYIVMVLALLSDAHHVQLDRKQAGLLAYVLQHYADTGAVRINEQS